MNKVLLTLIPGVFARSTNATLISRSGGQSFYEDHPDIIETTDSTINSLAGWNDQVAWAAGLTNNGIGGW